MKTWVSEALHVHMHACHNAHLAGMSAMKQWKLADRLKLITLASRDCALPPYGVSALPMTESSTRQRTRNNGEKEGGQERGKELKWKGERKEHEIALYFGRSQVWILLQCHHASVMIWSSDTKWANSQINRWNSAFTIYTVPICVSLKCIIL